MARLQAELETIEEDDWGRLPYGHAWAQIQLLKPDGRGGSHEHPCLPRCPYMLELAQSFGARVLDITLARLGPDGRVKPHCDISGGAPLGVLRIHIPLRTSPEVYFFVGGERVLMGEGETWTLDTTYRHWLENRSRIERVHLIVDLRMNGRLRKLLGPRQWGDLVHHVDFACFCFVRAASLLVRRPRYLVDRVERFVRLRLLGQSQLTFDK